MRAAIISVLGAFALAGCAAQAQAPDWFSQRSAENDSGYPSLRDVPSTTTANTDAQHWNAVKTEVMAAGQEMRANPRSAPATATETPEAFLDQAREDLEEARQSHE